MEKTIEISQGTYRTLIRIEERMNTLARFVEKDGYLTNEDIRLIIGMEPKEEKEEVSE
jgi:hypothetical protein